jgi:thymidine phosphorylase
MYSTILTAMRLTLAGAPDDAAAEAVIDVRLGDTVRIGQPLFTLHAQAPGEFAYAFAYVQFQPPIVEIDPTNTV